MGKSAGNCNTELLAMYLNENYDKNYDMLEILKCIELEILKYSQDNTWGYQLPFFLSALNKCHSTYAKYLKDKNTLTVKDINIILQKIDKEKKFNFDKNHIETLYNEYLNNASNNNIFMV